LNLPHDRDHIGGALVCTVNDFSSRPLARLVDLWIAYRNAARLSGCQVHVPRVLDLCEYAYRVSTQKQARSGKKGLGLGLEAQPRWRGSHSRTGARLSLEFTEIEAGKGAAALELRPQLASALSYFRQRAIFRLHVC
jgi:hypothetical protein